MSPMMVGATETADDPDAERHNRPGCSGTFRRLENPDSSRALICAGCGAVLPLERLEPIPEDDDEQ